MNENDKTTDARKAFWGQSDAELRAERDAWVAAKEAEAAARVAARKAPPAPEPVAEPVAAPVADDPAEAERLLSAYGSSDAAWEAEDERACFVLKRNGF